MNGPAVTRWWWVRHAPVVDFQGEINGQMDVDCVTDDAAAFRALADRLPADARVIATPLKRTRRTLDAVCAAGLALGEPEIEPAFMEQHFGDWQGRTWDAMRALDEGVYDRFWSDPVGNKTPGGESFAEVCARVAAAIDERSRTAGGDIVVFAHGGSIRAAVAHALDLTPARAMSLVVDNLSLTRLDHVAEGTLGGRGGAWRVGGVNLPPR